MTQITGICPTFPSRDLDATEAFYARIGFDRLSRYDAEGYLLLIRDGCEIHFWRKPGHDPSASEFMAYVRTPDAAALSRGFAALGLPTDGIPRFEPAEDKPWGMHELAVVDPDGNLLRIGTELP